MKRVLIPGVILCGADVAQAVDDKNMYMHVFEEMTVYAPVPVPVNGNTHYTSESIERLPTGNGNISDLLRTNPAVRMDSTQSTSLNQGDIRPEKISIHGASPYQNAYLIDGIMFTVKRMIKSAKAVVPTARLKPPLLNITTTAKPKRIRSTSVLNWPNPCISAR